MKVKQTKMKKSRLTSPPSSMRIVNQRKRLSKGIRRGKTSNKQINDFCALNILFSTSNNFEIYMIVGVTAVAFTIGLFIWDVKNKKKHQR